MEDTETYGVLLGDTVRYPHMTREQAERLARNYEAAGLGVPRVVTVGGDFGGAEALQRVVDEAARILTAQALVAPTRAAESDPEQAVTRSAYAHGRQHVAAGMAYYALGLAERHGLTVDGSALDFAESRLAEAGELV